MNLEAVAQYFRDRGYKILQRNGHFEVSCPVCEGRDGHHLYLDRGAKHPVVLTCHRNGCDPKAILAALDLKESDICRTDQPAPRHSKRSFGLTVEKLAERKRLAVEFLKGLDVQTSEVGKTEAGKVLIRALCDEDTWDSEVSTSVWPEVIIHYHNEDGTPAARHRRRYAITGKRKVCWDPGFGKTLPYGLDRLQAARKVGCLVIVEGETDCWTLWHHDYPALGLPGASTAGLLRSGYLKDISRLYVFQEPGDAGEQFVKSICKKLTSWRRWNGETYVVQLKEAGDPSELHVQDPDAFKAQFQRALDEAELVPEKKPTLDEGPESGTNKPCIVATNRDLCDKTDDALRALEDANSPPQIFRRLGGLARIKYDENGEATAQQLGETEMRGFLARAASFISTAKDGRSKRIDPPREIVQDVLALGRWKFPALEGIVGVPVIRQDGSLLSEPGYDPATRLFLAPNLMKIPAIPESPTKEETADARELLLEAVQDFPFVDQASRANALAALLTPMLRHTIDGNVPLALLDAPQPGTGKGLLAELIALVATGKPAAVMTLPRNDEELRKKITTALLSGRPIIHLDNLEGRLRSSVLSAALTARTWTDRILCTNDEVSLPQRATWIATGNNITIGGDLPRRCYWVRLDPKTSKPWERKGFRHENLPKWASENRSRLVAALLTLATAWVAKGKPNADTGKPMGSFTEWKDIVGGILANAGITGFLENRDELYIKADVEATEWESFLEQWAERVNHKVTVRALVQMIREEGDPHQLRELLPSFLADSVDTKGFSTRMGQALAKVEGKRFGDKNIFVTRDGTDGRTLYWDVCFGGNQ